MTVRIILPAAILVAALTVSACANTQGSRSRYDRDLERLAADCRERGGILTPSGASTTGRPQTDYVCDIRGVGARVGS